MVCDKNGGRRRARRRRDTESKTRTPHKDVGKKPFPRELRRIWAISGTDFLELPTIYSKAYVRLSFRDMHEIGICKRAQI